MKDNIIRFLGLNGSWKWACKQMDNGVIVRRSTDSGAAHYRLDCESQRRIVWCYTRNPHNEGSKEWGNAYIFLKDFECTDWVVV